MSPSKKTVQRWIDGKGWSICPVCLTTWSEMLGKKPGGKCGDLSLDQTDPCVGRLIPAHEFKRAEWRVPVNSEPRDFQVEVELNRWAPARLFTKVTP